MNKAELVSSVAKSANVTKVKAEMVLNSVLKNMVTKMKDGEKVRTIESMHSEGFGYQYEAQHVMECLDAGLIESPKMTWEISQQLMGILDRIRIDAGIFFPEHDKTLFI